MDQELDDCFGRFVFAVHTNKHLTRALPFLRGEKTTMRGSYNLAVKREKMAEEAQKLMETKEQKESNAGKESKESKDEKEGRTNMRRM